MTAQVHGFQTEVTKLLNLLANSLYSNKEVFLRELVSNASDAIDKLHFLALTNPDLVKDDPVFKIKITPDPKNQVLRISDNGIGMTMQEANDHLGTIAKSGTADFFQHLSGDQAKDAQLIGQFGVGFYSAFIVADQVTVISRSVNAKPEEAVKWSSDGSGTYTSEQVVKQDRGTEIILHLKDSEKDFLDTWTLRQAITKYSDHISTPVYLYEEKVQAPDKDDKDKKKEPVFEYVQINDAKALWTLAPQEVKEDQYKEFYKHLTHDYDDPLCWAHNRVEGELEYTSLLYVPKQAPWDLFNRDKQHGLKLFVQRVFIMDEAEQFLPNYLRFIKGLVDTNALPLNVSRELLQESAVTRKLKKALTKRALNMLGKLSKDPEKYKTFWQQFGQVIKEGTVEDYDNREAILKLMRFASTHNDNNEQNVSLDDYIARMPKGQSKIYYLTADSYQAAAGSPYLEALKRKNVEVLLMWERVDEWMMGNVSEYAGKQFVSAAASDLQLGDLADKEEEKKQQQEAEEHKDIVERLKKALGDKVQDVKVSSRLVSSPCCVVGAQGQPMFTAQMKRMLEAAGQKLPDEKYTLEINPTHPLLVKAGAEIDESRFAKWAQLILDQALLADQGSLKDPAAFVACMNDLLLK